MGDERRRVRSLAFFLSGAAASPAMAQDYPQGLPPPIQRFVERAIDCDHWQGEYPYDADRRAQIDHALRQLRCQTLPSERAALEKRYRHNPSVLKQLDEWAGPEKS